ncbi:TOR signalling pathway regulator [Aspergillus luchuensis]|uniref:TOR signalling pathway regulator n=1 Tax=Aspergillus kawachii TaxID=1069201 RepID=A0A146FDI7_ASPKA|nr:TOR signalling pathway regulator [Aspergillus luchuensis]
MTPGPQRTSPSIRVDAWDYSERGARPVAFDIQSGQFGFVLTAMDWHKGSGKIGRHYSVYPSTTRISIGTGLYYAPMIDISIDN